MQILARKRYRIQSWMFLGALPAHNSAELRNSLELVNLKAALNNCVFGAVVVLQRPCRKILHRHQ